MTSLQLTGQTDPTLSKQRLILQGGQVICSVLSFNEFHSIKILRNHLEFEATRSSFLTINKVIRQFAGSQLSSRKGF